MLNFSLTRKLSGANLSFVPFADTKAPASLPHTSGMRYFISLISELQQQKFGLF